MAAADGRGSVSPELDAMVGDILASFLDALAEGDDPGVVACVEDARANRYAAAFADDGIEACIEAARRYVTAHAAGVPEEHVGRVERYAVAYAGCVDLDDGYQDAIIVSFFERGQDSGYSAYVLFDGAGTGDDFRWAEPEPAGEEEPLI